MIKRLSLKEKSLQGTLQSHVDKHSFLHRDSSREKYYLNPKSFEKEKLEMEIDFENRYNEFNDRLAEKITKEQYKDLTSHDLKYIKRVMRENEELGKRLQIIVEGEVIEFQTYQEWKSSKTTNDGFKLDLQFFGNRKSDKEIIEERIANGMLDGELFYIRRKEFNDIFSKGVQTPIETVYNKGDRYYHIIQRHEKDLFNDDGIERIVKSLKEPNEIRVTRDFAGRKANCYIEKTKENKIPLVSIVRNGIVTSYIPDEGYYKNTILKKGELVYEDNNANDRL